MKIPKYWIEILAQWSMIRDANSELAHETKQQNKLLTLQLSAMARVIAKLDPAYGIPEDHPYKVAMNNALANTVIAQLKADALAHAHNDPEREAQLKRYFGDSP